MKRYIKSSTLDLGIPDKRPTKQQVLSDIKKLRGAELSAAVSRLDSSGNWYREDRRQKRRYLEEVVNYNYYDDPVDNYDILDAIDSNDEILYAVYGINRYSPEFVQQFGLYDIDTLFRRKQLTR